MTSGLVRLIVQLVVSFLKSTSSKKRERITTWATQRRWTVTDAQEQKTKSPQDSRTIKIEIPISSFAGMFRMLMGRRNFGAAGSCCSGMMVDERCSQSEGESGQEFTFVLKRKE